MDAYCLKCRRKVDQPSREKLIAATEARMAGKLVNWDCPKCGGLVVGVKELVDPQTIKSPFQLIDYTPDPIEVRTEKPDPE